MLLRRALLAGGGCVDVRITGSSIASVAPELAPAPGEVVHDLGGSLLLPALVEPHAHLDKAFLAERIHNPTGDLIGAIEALHANRGLITLEDTIERASRAIGLLVRNGTTAIRTHVDVTIGNGLMSAEALLTVRERLGHLADLQIVAMPGFPVTGDAGKAQVRLLREALALGVDLLGGCPHLEDDVAGATSLLLDLAAEHGIGVDLHTDETLDPHKLGLLDLADQVIATGFAHPVAASHCVSLGMLAADEQRRIADRVAEAGISVVANPDTNLYLQGRGRFSAMPRGLTAVQTLRAAGVNVTAGSDNLQDPFNPLGRGDPLEAAALLVLAAHQLPVDAFAAVTTAGRRAMALPVAAIEPGAPAELVAIPVGTVREAIAYAPPRRMVVHAGSVVFSGGG